MTTTKHLFPKYNTMLFCNIYSDVNEFLADYGELGIPKTILDANVMTLYYLLFSRYGNTPIANLDVTQFKIKLQAVIFQYGPTWEKRLDIQTNLRNLTEEEILRGAKTVYNHAFNPETQPSTGDITELNYINEQNTQNFIKNKLTAYSELMGLLETDVTGEFLDKFKYLFKIVVAPTKPIIYVTDVEGDEDE